MKQETRSIRDIGNFINVARAWQQKNPKGDELAQLRYAVSKVLKSCIMTNARYEDKINWINIKHGSIDEKKNLLTDPNGKIIFTQENLGKRNAEVLEAQEGDAEVGIYFATNIPVGVLTVIEEDAFAGFVIPEMQEPEPPAEK
jgi:hypothetical protein